MIPRKTRVLARAALAFAMSMILSLAPSQAADQRQGKNLPRIGYLHFGSGLGAHDRAFIGGLADLGYVDGKTIVIENRGAPRRDEAGLHAAAAELVRRKVDVIVALVPAAVRAAMRATRTVPIVMRYTADPIGAGLVASLARPGGNVTGVTSISSNLTGKRIELLKEMVPGLAHVGVIWVSHGRTRPGSFELIEAASRLLGVTVRFFPVSTTDDFGAVFSAAADGGIQGLVVLRSPLTVRQRERLADLAIQSRLPTVFDERQFAEAGGLMSYGADLGHLYRRAADYVDRIIRGATPADLPIEQPTRFELVVNLRTAKALGIAIPPSILLRADEAVE